MARNRKKLGSLTKQIQDNLDLKLAIGHSKHLDKQFNKDDFNYTSYNIYSWSTYKSYLKHLNYFANYCKQEHQCKTLDDCKKYIGEWLQTRNDLSPYTIKLEIAALCKLYDMSTKDIKDQYGYESPKRQRLNITRSRGDAIRDKHFSIDKNIDFVTFCRCTGLRRNEIKSLKIDKIRQIEGKFYIVVDSGTKGGRPRTIPIMTQSQDELKIVLKCFFKGDMGLVDEYLAKGSTIALETILEDIGNDTRVFDKIPSNCDIHSYRGEYATRCYQSKARPIDELQGKQIYHMRCDRKGTHLDRSAMLFASKCLGHNRIDVVASHYLM